MSVALLLITHEHIGYNMLKVTGSILKDTLSNTACIEIPMDSDTNVMKKRIASTIKTLDTEEGILIVTDTFGGTPCNIATEFVAQKAHALVSGLNLPMLIRIMNYRSLPLGQLQEAAIEGGVRGITADPN